MVIHKEHERACTVVMRIFQAPTWLWILNDIFAGESARVEAEILFHANEATREGWSQRGHGTVDSTVDVPRTKTLRDGL